MRGKLTGTVKVRPLGGNIPAYAGKTLRTPRPAWLCEEHPRVCGENGRLSIGLAQRTGNIPAYAGKTDSRAAQPNNL